MLEAGVCRNLPFNDAVVWSLLADWGNTQWIKKLENAELVESEQGLIRRVIVPNVGPFDEVLLSLDHASQQLRYTIPRGPIFPFDDYIGSVAVTALAANECQVEWRCTFNAGALPVAEAPAKAEANIHNLLNMLTEYLDKQR